MSSLNFNEKRSLENLFDMDSGYVLGFTNRTFAEFFKDLHIDIDSEKYSTKGASKASRFRAFWDIEPDAIVGKALSMMLDYFIDHKCNIDPAINDNYKKCRIIANRLLGIQDSNKDLEQQFLNENFSDISIQSVPIEGSLLPIMDARLTEAIQCLQANSPLAVIFLCGSVLEGLLLGLAAQKPQKFNQAPSSPKDSSGKVLQFKDWSLAQLIDVACELKFLKLDIKKFGHSLRDFRNYIHPYEQIASGFSPDRHTAEICLQVLKAAIADLSGKRK